VEEIPANSQEINRVNQHMTKPKYEKPKPQYSKTGHGNQQGGARRNVPKSEEICYRCGNKGHYGRDCRITRGKKCKNCGREGHFAKMCKTKLLNFVHENDEETNEEFVSGVTKYKSPTTKVLINNQTAHVIIDTGGSVNILDGETFQKLFPGNKNLKQSNSKIFVYGSSTPLKQLGIIKVNVKYNTETTTADFHVIPGKFGDLISKNTAEKLKMIKTAPELVQSINQETHEIVQKYEDLVVGLGKLKNYQLKLYRDETVKPVAQPMRRLPYDMREAVEKKIKELETLDVIERVEGPTPWVSPLVCIPKANQNDVRICVDLRQAKNAIMREKFPIPIVEETLQEMNRATCFSKLGLKSGFHQIQLEENSRHITTFVCHKG
jgi:hypothetical protein